MWLKNSLKFLLIFCFQIEFNYSYFNQVLKDEELKFNPCYLSNRRSSQTFIVNEALSINSLIGELQVLGNISDEIELSVAENNLLDGQEVPIRLESGSKKIILTRKLDKEGLEGEHGIIIGIKCRKKFVTNEPSTIIPVRIIVTDANDHSPHFIGAPYVINVSEATAVGSKLIPNAKIFALDEDQQGPFSTVEYYLEPSPFSHLIQFKSKLSGSLILISPLDYETLPKFLVVIRAQDQGDPPNTATTTLSVIVQDADDQNPRFLDDQYTSILPPKSNEFLNIKPRAIFAFDPDEQINSPIQYLFNGPESSTEYSYFSINSNSGAIQLTKPLQVNINLPLTLIIKAIQTDNKDRYALTTLTINNSQEIDSENIYFLKSNYNASIFENVPIGYTVLTVQTTQSINEMRKLLSSTSTSFSSMSGYLPPLSPSSTSISILSKFLPIKYKLLDNGDNYFEIQENGDILVKKPLDYEISPQLSFRVMASNDKHNDVAQVYISLINVNDNSPQFTQIYYHFYVNEGRNRSNNLYVGQLNATDNDMTDNLTFNVEKPLDELFFIDEQGKLFIENLTILTKNQYHLLVTANDNGYPPRTASTVVTVEIDPSLLYLKNSSQEVKLDDYRFFKLSIFPSSITPLALIFIISFGIILASFLITIVIFFILTCHRPKKQASTSISNSGADISPITCVHSLYLDKCFPGTSYIPSKQLYNLSPSDRSRVFSSLNQF